MRGSTLCHSAIHPCMACVTVGFWGYGDTFGPSVITNEDREAELGPVWPSGMPLGLQTAKGDLLPQVVAPEAFVRRCIAKPMALPVSSAHRSLR